MTSSCNPARVMGEMMALGDIHGADIDPAIITEDMPPAEKAAYYETVDKASSEVHDSMRDTKQQQADNKALTAAKKLGGDMITPTKAIFTDFANPSRVLGNDLVTELDNILIDLKNSHSGNGFAAKEAFNHSVGDFFERVNTDDFDDAQLRYFERYKDFYSDFNKFNGIGQHKGYIEERLDSITRGVIHLSPNVMVGNLVEGVMKLPALYGTDALTGLKMAMQDGGLWHESPELVRQGIFGREYAGQAAKGWIDKVMGATDTPLKKISYYAGFAKGGEEAGRLAVQRVTFAPRMADMPLVYHTPIGRSSVRLLGYTISTYKMLGNLVEGLTKKETMAQSALGLGWYTALAWGMGGAAGAIPTPVQTLIGVFDGIAGTDYKDQINNDQGALTKLIQTNGISRINITTDLFNKAISTVGKWADGGEVKPTDVVFALSTIFLKNDYFNNREVQRIVKSGYDVYTGEMEPGEAAQKSFAPFTIAN